jgi:hypothetical protein
VNFLDLDTVELRARTCLESGSGTIEPQTVLELVRLLRAGNKAMGASVLVAAPLDNGRADPVGSFPHKFAANVGEILERGERLGEAKTESLGLAFAGEPVCSCDESLALRKRIAEFETQLTYASTDFLSLRARIRDLETKLDLYERAEPNGAMERLRKFLLDEHGRHDLSWSDGARDAEVLRRGNEIAGELHRWMVATERRAVDAEAKTAELEARLAAPLPSVGGEWVEGTIRDLERAAQLAIDEEQSKANPDSHYIAVFCNTVRLCRESNRLAKGSLIQPPPMGHAASKEAESDG